MRHRLKGLAPLAVGAAFLCGSLMLACRGEGPTDETPEGAFELFYGAMCTSGQAFQSRDRSKAYELLAPETQQELESRAKIASEQAGKALLPSDMLAVEKCLGNWKQRQTEATIKGDRATITVQGEEASQKATVEAVKVDGSWRIVMPL